MEVDSVRLMSQQLRAETDETMHGEMTGGQLLLSLLFSEDSETEEDFSVVVMVDQVADAVLRRLVPISRLDLTTRLLPQSSTDWKTASALLVMTSLLR